jgi:peptidoglycan/xylan/chitin deacetylase (PgdA/CDA1 family)
VRQRIISKAFVGRLAIQQLKIAFRPCLVQIAQRNAMSVVRTSLVERFFASRALNTIARKVLPNWVTVLMLHRLRTSEGNTSGLDPAYLDSALNYLCEQGYEFISIDDAIARAFAGTLEQKKWLAFSLDDGFSEQVAAAGNILNKYNCPSTCFLITGFVDGQLWPWDYQLEYIAQKSPAQTIELVVKGQTHRITLGTPSTKNFLHFFVRLIEPENAYALVQRIADAARVELPDVPPLHMRATTWDEVRAMEKLGMQFGAHSVTHRILASLDQSTLHHEITESIRRVTAECANPASVFCYPSGKAHEFDSRAIEIVKHTGLKGAMSAEPGHLEPSHLIGSHNYRFVIPRISFPKSFNDLIRYTSWAHYVREQMTRNPLQNYFD